MAYASQKYVKDLLGQTLKTAKEQGLLGGGGSSESGGSGDTYVGFYDYSEEEQIVGQWIDGKPLYQKVVLKDNFKDFISNNFSLIDNIININKKIFVSTYANPTVFPLTRSNTSSSLSKWVQEFINFIGATQATIDGNWGDGTTKALNITLKYLGFEETGSITEEVFNYITKGYYINNDNDNNFLDIRYTKTTDEPSSFLPSMVTNNIKVTGIHYDDYSEEEKVIGKWIDGKPIYCHVVNYTIKEANKDYIIETIPDLDKIISLEFGFYSDSVQRYLGDNYFVSSSDNFRCWYYNGLKCRVTSLVADKLMAIIQYTKTTDEPNSFKPEMIIDGVVPAPSGGSGSAGAVLEIIPMLKSYIGRTVDIIKPNGDIFQTITIENPSTVYGLIDDGEYTLKIYSDDKSTFVEKTFKLDVFKKYTVYAGEEVLVSHSTEYREECIASGTYSYRTPEGAFDGITGTYNMWTVPSGNGPGWLGIKLKNPSSCSKIRLKMSALKSSKDGVFIFRGSNDKEEWVELTDTLPLPNVTDEFFTYDIKSQNEYLYYSIYSPSWGTGYNSGQQYWIDELEIYCYV